MKTKEYIRPLPATWWLHNRYLVIVMIRELSSLFVAAFAIFLLVLLYHANHGAFREFYSGVLQSWWIKAFGWISLAFVAFHSVTSFNLAPTIMAPRWGEERIHPLVIIGANYGLWLIVTLVILIVVL